MRPVGQPDVLGHAVPVPNLAAGLGVGVGLGRATRQRVAIEILELRRQLPHDAGLALGREVRHPQPAPHEGGPVTHRLLPSRR